MNAVSRSVISLPPDPLPVAPAFEVPPRACDCHIHLFGPFARFPLVRREPFVPAEATFDMYAATAQSLFLERAVVVQSAAYGDDHSCLLDGLARAEGRWRGIALIGDTTSDKDLEILDAAGVVGARLNFVEAGAGRQSLQRVASRIRGLNWHVELLMTLDFVEKHRAELAQLQIPFVIDHMGYTRAEQSLGHPGFETLKAMVRDGVCWTKLSGVDRIGNRAIGYDDARRIVAALLQCNDRRLVWGSDWPHVSRRTMPNDGALLNLLARWAGEAQLARVLAENPAALYRF
jgi:2-pyrone-4,6-dicarboxylate lactonase